MNIKSFIKNIIKFVFKENSYNDLYLNLDKIHEALLDKAKNKEFINIKKELEELILKKETLNKIYWSNQSLSIKKEIEALDEKILKKQVMAEIYRLESLKLKAFNEFYKKFKVMDSKSNELKNSLKNKNYKIALKLKANEEKTKADEKIEAIKKEVLNAIKELKNSNLKRL
ncbi:MAG: hypothetical protein QW589_01690 [Candidatus Bathyarchaeia archaeon]